MVEVSGIRNGPYAAQTVLLALKVDLAWVHSVLTKKIAYVWFIPVWPVYANGVLADNVGAEGSEKYVALRNTTGNYSRHESLRTQLLNDGIDNALPMLRTQGLDF